MNDIIDFAQYLHNPWGYLTPKQEAAKTAALRVEKFVEGYSIDEELITLLNLYFSDKELLNQYGLKKFYTLLMMNVKDKHLIGIILYGTNIDDRKDKLINSYYTVNGDNIKLTIKSICQFLIRDYIKMDNLDSLCEKVPNFDIYYKNNNLVV